MDLKEYISSGIIELYAMGTLTAEEKSEFERNLLMYPELRTELMHVQRTLETYTATSSRNPRPSLRSEILESVKADAAPAKSRAAEPRLHDSHSLTYKYLIAASLAALVISTFASWFFYTRWNEAEDRYVSSLNEKNQLAQNFNVMKATFDKTYSDMMVMRDENAKVYTLMPKDSTKKYQVRVYWNKYTREAFVDVLSMPAAPAGMQYQLWALVGGQPVDAGVFSMGDEEGMHRMKDVITSDAWAVTMEPMGGSPAPTMDQLVLVSKTS